MENKELNIEDTPKGPELTDIKPAAIEAGEIVTVNAPMDRFFGRKGVVEYVSPYDSGISVRFDDGARSYYTYYQLVKENKEEKKVSRIRYYREVQKAHDWANIETIMNALSQLKGSLDEFFMEEADEKEASEKTQPTSSQVHVPGMMGNEDEVKKKPLTTTGREHVKPSNFVFPSEQKYPIHDLAHAKNALSRSSGKPEEAKVKAAVYAKYPQLKKNTEKDIDADDQLNMYPGIDNLDGGITKAELGDDSNIVDMAPMWDYQRLVEGMDWELEHTTEDPSIAKEVAMYNLEGDKNHYAALRMEEDGTDDELAKDTRETEEDPWANEGFNIDIGSGNAREPGYIGLDTYPYDHGTMVHDVSMGLPFEDGSAKKVRLCNSLDGMEGLSEDPKPLLSEIHRVLMPGGQFTYEGPNDIYNYSEWTQDYPGLVLTDHEDSNPPNEVDKEDKDAGPLYRQTFTRLAVPDPATANDAEPRIGVSQYDDLPADALLGMDALSYYWSDATSSGRGNRMHGYPSQGALVDSGPWVEKDQTADGEDDSATSMSEAMAQVSEALRRKKIVNPIAPNRSLTHKSVVQKILEEGKIVPIIKAVPHKQIVYGVILAPNEMDAQDDFMEPEDIEKAAHHYLSKSRVIGSVHEKPIDAEPVESFIAPQDFEVTGQYGPQPVKKGSWVLGVKVHDPEEWQKILNGEYTGFSVGGLGVRQTM